MQEPEPVRTEPFELADDRRFSESYPGIAGWKQDVQDTIRRAERIAERRRRRDMFRPAPALHPETARMLVDAVYGVPHPIRGGTFFYCPWRETLPGAVRTCGRLRPGWASGSRFSTAAAYRRHWRRHHFADRTAEETPVYVTADELAGFRAAGLLPPSLEELRNMDLLDAVNERLRSRYHG